MARCPKPRNLVCKLGPARQSAPSTGSFANHCQVAAFVQQLIGDEAREHFVVVYLSAKYCPIGYDVFTMGAVSAVNIDPSSPIRSAVMLGAVAMITAHNHPSGDASPTEADHSTWAEIDRRGKCLGISLLDNLVLGVDAFYSSTGNVVTPYESCAGTVLEGACRSRRPRYR